MLPNLLKVGAFDYTIVGVTEDLFDENGTRLGGEINHDDQQIHIDVRLHTDRQKEILIHELLHACWVERNLFKNDEAAEVEEEVVSQLASGLAAVFKQNPELIGYLNE